MYPMLTPPMSLLFHLIVLFFASSLLFRTSFSTVLAPITIDRSFRFFKLSVYLNNSYSLQPSDLKLDISSPLSWVAECSTGYHLIPCSSSLCTALRSDVCSNCSPSTDLGVCYRNSCVILPHKSSSQKTMMDVAIAESFSLRTTNGRNPGRLTVIPEFVFLCSKKSLGTKGTAGVAALGRSNFSLSAQVSRTTPPSSQVFALCLSGSPSAPGVAFFGSRGPYFFFPEVDLSNFLDYTPLLPSPVRRTRQSAQYYIGLTGIRVNDKPIRLNPSTMNRRDLGGAMLDTLTPYTMIHGSIYQTFVEAFINESAVLNLTVITQPVKPFEVCYKADDIMETNVGPAVPVVDLVMRSEDVMWRIWGWNSMVRTSGGDGGIDLWCLGFINGGMKLRSLIVVGGHQMIDNLLQFDMENNRLGYTSITMAHNTMCANFNFTINNTMLY